MNPNNSEPFADALDDEMLAMAYVDGELPPDERVAFEARLASEAALGAHVEEMRSLALVTRGMLPAEPEDREWRRLNRDPIHKGATYFAWILGLVAMVGIAVAAVASVDPTDTHWGVLLFAAFGSLAVLVLLAVTIRERLAVLPHDPYRKVHR